MFHLFVYIFISSEGKYLGCPLMDIQCYLSKCPFNLMMLTCFYDTH